MKTKVCHLTSAHARYDTRIFLKECRSLSEAGYEVVLLVADGEDEEIKDGVCIKSVTKSEGRLSRMWQNVNNIYKLALKEDADIYHLHDPELLRIALKLKKKGKKVIFDSHEDVPSQIVDKKWIPYPVRSIVAILFKNYQNYICKRLDAISTATPFIKEIFLKINPITVNVGNFPILAEFDESYSSEEKDKVTFIGGITDIRGAEEMVLAMESTKDVKLVLAGHFFSTTLQEKMESHKGWEKTNFVGFLDRPSIAKLLSESIAGLVVFKPALNHQDALPIKMFEYMAAGIPIIASNFTYWKEIVDENNCGVCVNPLNPKEIGAKIQYLKDNPDLCKQMGINGKKAVKDKYNWTVESEKLISLYQSLNN